MRLKEARSHSMKQRTSTRRSHDLLSNPRLAFVLFCVPAIAMVSTGARQVSDVWRTAVWAAALGIMGVACLANAARCGRVHCYLTGPFLLAMAVVTLLYGVGMIPLGRHGWTALTLAILIGAIVLTCLPEIFFGKYRTDRGGDSHS